MSNPALENVARIVAWSRHDRGTDRSAARPLEIRNVGIVGAGMMGTAIAAAHVRHQVPIVIHDADAAALVGAIPAIVAELRATDADSRTESVGRLVRPAAELAEAASCDLVVESIVETLSAKRQLYGQMRPHLAEHTIVVSNTSTIPIQQLAGHFPDARRFCGMHFFHPVRQRPLVEVVRGPQTSDLTIDAVVAHAKSIERMPIVVRDGPGFLVNRLLFPYLGEALELLREGVPPESIERAAAEFGMAIGPLRLMDEIGLDITLQAGWVLSAAFPERIMPSPVLVSMVKAGRLGRKNGAGFFSYPGRKELAGQDAADPAVAEILAPWINAAPPDGRKSMACRLVLPMLLEATHILEEDRVRDVRDIDLAVLFGLGFPAEKGGLLWWADTLGADRVLMELQSLGTTAPRLEPTALLRVMAKSGRRFYQSVFETWSPLPLGTSMFETMSPLPLGEG